ncbi:Nitric oxide reductase subunit B [bacterium HR36]|nr:Nitric oxide reductase subunit B [bacterium HR36]
MARMWRLWLALGVVMAGSFAVLLYYGRELAIEAPPLPGQVRTASGRLLLTREQILDGQNVWQSIGGMQLGSIWGHGSYIAPDWSADWLHRECLWLLEHWAKIEYGQRYAALPAAQQAVLRERLKQEMRTNRYDARTDTLLLSEDRAEAFSALCRYYAAIFSHEQEFPPEIAFLADGEKTPAELREAYAMPADTVRDPQRMQELCAFFFWTAWACATNRPASHSASLPSGESVGVSYTNNWPAEPLIDNRPTGQTVVWSVVSFVLLLAGVALLAWHHATSSDQNPVADDVPASDPLLALHPTPSMQATLKYFWVVFALLIVQIGLGAVTAHYGVEGQGFYGIPLSKWLPYSVTRTWHTQLGIFWIATAWLAAGLFMAPAVSGYEPPGQRLGVNILFVALLILVVGGLFGTWLGTRQVLDLRQNFWFGHQGYEYADLGRFWQILLFVGLLFWLGLVLRALGPAFRQPGQHKHLLALFVIASAAIGLFYGAGLMWGRRTHLSLVEYWRWWVVHLWVEGFFEVFATVVIAFLFTRMGLLRVITATSAVLFSSAVFLFGGIIGTFHHLYFTGTPSVIMALGATFSALEVVPLVLMGFEAWENLTLSRAAPWVSGYRWPIYCFIAVAFWNLVGAGLFGFFINPPIALYYMQGLNTTPVHGHTALFGVYGMLGIGLSLFCLRGLASRQTWRTAPLAFSFWAINIGLALMVLLSLLPVGLLQTWASVERGLWYARSAEFLQQPLLNVLRWLRVIGDTIFALGAVVLAWFVLGLKTGWSLAESPALPTQDASAPSVGELMRV